jgi:hypothetical protein
VNLFKRFCYFAPDGDGGSGAPAGGGQAPPTGDSAPRSYDETYVSKLRDEAAKHRTEKQEALAELKTLNDGQESELQKVQERAEAAEKRAAREGEPHYRVGREGGRIPMRRDWKETRSSRPDPTHSTGAPHVPQPVCRRKRRRP